MRKKERYEQTKIVKIEERKKKGRYNVKELKRNKIFPC